MTMLVVCMYVRMYVSASLPSGQVMVNDRPLRIGLSGRAE